MKVEQSGKITFDRRFSFYNGNTKIDKVNIKTEDNREYSFEIPGNYEQWHINNIVRDYNNGERTLILS